jgi:hypothetical protein
MDGVRVCLMGALRKVVATVDPGLGVMACRALGFAVDPIGLMCPGVSEWNDEKGRTCSEVVTRLRLAAFGEVR